VTLGRSLVDIRPQVVLGRAWGHLWQRENIERSDDHQLCEQPHWHDRAAEMKALARTVQDLEAIATMNRLADDYDKLADRADARSNGEVPPG
jgi:hypothetical protein